MAKAIGFLTMDMQSSLPNALCLGSRDYFAHRTLPTCGQNDSFFCSVKNSFRGVLKIPSEEISHRVGKIVWAKSFSFLLFCPKEE